MKTTRFLRIRLACLALVISSVAFTQERCNFYNLREKLQQVLDSSANSLGIKGISAALNLPGNKTITLVSGYSYDDVKITPATLFGAGSITKNFIAATILQLEEERKLSINDPIKKYFPNHTNINGNITIKELLGHTSGIFDYTENDTFFVKVFENPDKIWTTEEMYTYVLEQNFTHNTDWRYSNTNFIILGNIIEKITKNSVSKELSKRFFCPLQLKATVLYPEMPYNGELSHVYFDVFDYTAIVGPSLFSCAWAAGGIISTPTDLAKWSKALYTGKILKHNTLNKMLTPSPFNPNYGLGTMMLNVDGQNTYGHFGDILYNSYVNYFPDDKLSIAVMGNKAGTLVESVMVALYNGYKDYEAQINKPQVIISCYPMPFRTTLTINYELFKDSKVSIKITNAYGIEIAKFNNCDGETGKHSFTWNGLYKNGKQVPVGVYYYSVIVDNKAYSGVILKNK